MKQWLEFELDKLADGVTVQPWRKQLRIYVLYAALCRRDGHIERAKGVLPMIHALQQKIAFRERYT